MKEGLEAEFRDRGVERGGLLLLVAADALALIDRARDEGIQVLGIDGFRVQATSTEPNLEHSIDLSRSSTADSWTAATAFIHARTTEDLMFEVVLE